MLACIGILLIGSSSASALPQGHTGPIPGVVLAQAGPPSFAGSGDRFADLYEILRATRAKLEELMEAAASVAAERRQTIEALEQDIARLTAELERANARGLELENAGKRAQAELADLTEALDAARQEAARLDEDMTGLREQNEQLGRDLARAEADREAAAAEAEKFRSEMTERLAAAEEEIEQSDIELASHREQLQTARQELAKANEARGQAVSRASAMEQAVERFRAETERLKTDLAQTQEQLDQAAGAAVAAERARQAATSEADAARDEAARAREELAAARNESDRLETANAELREQIASLHADSRSATETARANLDLMEERLGELTAALGLSPSREPAAIRAGEVRPGTGEEQPTAASQPSAPTPRPTTEQEPAGIDTAALSSEGSGEPRAATSDEASADGDDEAEDGLERFRADVRALNDLELGAGGLDLFSGIGSVEGREVQVRTTSAWDTLPPIGQQSYLDSLLDSWVAIQGGDDPAVVRIVDPNGQVLIEKSWP